MARPRNRGLFRAGGGIQIRSSFVPTSIAGLALWLDAADSTSVTHSSGAVSQWSDKSGNARHFTQSVSGSKPTTNTRTQNGRNVIDFDGTDDTLELLTPFWYDLVTSTLFVVCLTDGTPSGLETIIYEHTTTVKPEYGLRMNASGKAEIVYVDSVGINGTVKWVVASTPTAANSTPHLVRMTDSGTIAKIAINGGAEDSSASYTRTTTSPDRTRIGTKLGTNGPRPHDGWVAECLIYNTVLSAGNITLVESYLTTKWGL